LGEIRCTCIPLPNGLKIILQDYGRAFNPSKIPTPNTKARLKEVKSRGAGLFIIQKMMDEVHFEFTAESGNILTMVKYLGKKKKKKR
jgi:serine/threonine-protein kinase RsbW